MNIYYPCCVSKQKAENYFQRLWGIFGDPFRLKERAYSYCA